MAAPAPDPGLSFIDNFQAEIDRLGCSAIVEPAGKGMPSATMALLDGDGVFITLMPMSVTPETAVFAFGLHQLGLRTGRRLGEECTREKLRTMMRAPTVADCWR